MLTYAVRRLFGAIPTLFLIITIAFFMIRLAPGGPFDTERALPAEIEANLMRAYHLDQPLPVQYVNYLGGILSGDFGPSFRYKDFSVNELIWGGFPTSFRIGGLAILAAALIGTGLGAFAALRRNSWLDHTVMAGAMTGITIPNFVVAPALSLIFGVYLGWLPVAGSGTWSHLLLPVVALALPQIAYIARLTRAGTIEVLRSNFIRTARAKGLPDRVLLTRHALKGALLPVISYLGPATAGIVTGSVVIEQIFQLPGIGRYFVQGALNRDYTLVMGVVIFYGMLIIVFNLIVDLLYGVLDPRVRFD
ncbi:MAG TPA: oligopeptide ABC transporter permease OppB [Arenibaculum sp.]|nr:oligopeptide ABC transporter permease OppB [Arenibaculum sp.]